MKYLIEYTHTYHDVDYYYPDLLEIEMEAKNQTDAIIQFKKKFPSDSLNGYHVDSIQQLTE